MTDLEVLKGQEVEHTSLGKTMDRSDLYLLKNNDKKYDNSLGASKVNDLYETQRPINVKRVVHSR